jgi:hypothetical protein
VPSSSPVLEIELIEDVQDEEVVLASKLMKYVPLSIDSTSDEQQSSEADIPTFLRHCSDFEAEISLQYGDLPEVEYEDEDYEIKEEEPFLEHGLLPLCSWDFKFEGGATNRGRRVKF